MLSNQQEQLWLDDDSRKNRGKHLKNWLKRSPTKLLHYFELDSSNSSSNGSNSKPRHRRVQTVSISSPYDFNHVAHIDMNSQFGVEKSFRNGTNVSHSFPSSRSISSYLSQNPNASQKTIEPEIQAKTLDREGDVSFQVFSGFKTCPTTDLPLTDTQQTSQPKSHGRTRSTSTTVSTSRSNSVFTRSNSVTTLATAPSPSAMSPQHSVSGYTASIKKQNSLNLHNHRRLTSIPQENTEDLHGLALSLADKRLEDSPMPRSRPIYPTSPPSPSFQEFKLEKISIPSLNSTGTDPRTSGSSSADSSSRRTSLDPAERLSRSTFTSYSSSSDNKLNSLLESEEHHHRIHKVPSVGSPPHSRHSSFTFELLNASPKNLQPLQRGLSQRDTLRDGGIILKQFEFREEEEELTLENVDGEDDLDSIDELQSTIVSLSAANHIRASRLSLSSELSRVSSCRVSRSESQLSLPFPDYYL